MISKPVLTVDDLSVHFPIKKGLLSRTKGYVHAVNGISFHLNKGETLGIVGESGCGKSTAALAVLNLVPKTGGRITFMDKDISDRSTLDRPTRLKLRQQMQIIFQDPFSSLNPRTTLDKVLDTPMKIHGLYSEKERRERVAYLLEKVGLTAEQGRRYPHEFSGGQRQRIGIARALALNPSIIIGDEPVSALDVSIQAQIINLLVDLQKEFDLSYIFIAHDLAVVEHISDRIAVMYLGKIVETATYQALYAHPLHPYTQALLSAIPIPDPRAKRRRIILKGDVPSPRRPPSGCTFHPRCPKRMDICDREIPRLKIISPGHEVACHLYAH